LANSIGMRAALALIVCLVPAGRTLAQTAETTIPSPRQPLPRYGFDRFTVQEGLPEIYVQHLMQDSKGYLWVATQNGLARYDGQTFRTVLPSDGTHTLRSVTSVTEDSRGVLWAGGAFESGLAREHRAANTWSFSFHDPNDRASLSDNNIAAIIDAGHDMLLVITDPTSDVFRTCIDRVNSVSGEVRRLRLASNGTVGEEGQCFGPIPGVVSAAQRNVFSRDEASAKTWVATWHGLLSYDPVADEAVISNPLLNSFDDWGALEALVESVEPLSALREVGGNENRTTTFELSEATSVLLVGLGELRPGQKLDHGWLENAEGDTLWSMVALESAWAGGALRNRLVVDTQVLPAGGYELHYQSDQGHSFGEVFDGAPDNQDWWGAMVLPLEPDAPPVPSTGPVRVEGTHLPESVTAVHVDSGGNLWAGTEGRGFFLRRAGTTEFSRFEAEGEAGDFGAALVVSITTDLQGRALVGTTNGLYRIDFDEGKVEHEGDDLVLRVYRDEQDLLWVHALNGLTHLDWGRDEQVYSAVGENSDDLGNGQAVNSFMDRQGNLWFATRSGGLSRLNRTKNQFQEIDVERLGSGPVRWSWEGPGGHLWFATGDGLSRATPGDIESGKAATKVTDKALKAYVDRRGGIWGFRRGSGLQKFDSDGSVLASYRHDPTNERSLGSDNVNVMLEDTQGRLWVGLSGEGVNGFDPETGLFTRYPFRRTPRAGVSDSLDDAIVFELMEDSRGTIWVGTNLGGSSRFDPESGTFTSNFDDGQGMVAVQDIYEDSAQRLWVGTYIGGLFQIDPGTGQVLAQHDETDGLIHNSVRTIQEDNSGHLWLGTGRGLVRFDPESETFRTFLRPNGMTELTFSGTSLKLKSGMLLFGGDQGVIMFDPEALSSDSGPPAVAVEMVTHRSPVGDIRVPVRGESTIRLAHDENDVTFDYVGIDFKHADGIRYRYQLAPYDSDWIDAGTDRSARYTSLQPRWYTFRVQAVNAEGVWSEVQSVTVWILPPWWKTWWAYALYSLPLFALGAGMILVVQRRAKEKERERSHRELEDAYSQLDTSHRKLKDTQAQLLQQEKLASLGQLTAGIAHEIKNPLNFVNNFAEVNAELADELSAALAAGDTEEVATLLEDLRGNALQIAKHGKRADSIVRSMMQHARGGASDREEIDVNAFLGDYVDLAWHGMRARDDEFNADVARDFGQDAGQLTVMPQELGRVVLNLLNNAFDAVRGRAESVVTVSSRRHGSGVEICVSDNGPGIRPEIRERIFEPFFTTKATGEGTGLGLSLSYDIVTKGHGGSMTVGESEGGGATFSVLLPDTPGLPDARPQTL
jgi:signal transduction histidine kinase/ligand-binding sensor domain-containing protein